MKNKSDYDSGWKEIIELYLPQFIEFFYPELNKLIDYTKGYDFLDKELNQIIPSNETGRKAVDKLVKVFYRNGEEKWLLLHIEIQSQYEKDFARRIFIYNYKILDKYKNRDVISLVVLGDTNKSFRPNKYQIKYPDFELTFKYKIVKLIDYIGKEKELENSNNPFAIIILSHLKSLQAKQDIQKKYIFKFLLVKKLRNKGFNKDDIYNLHKFIDWILKLPEELELQLAEDIFRIEEETKMPLMLTIEKLGIKKGKLEGKREGKFEIVKRMIKKGMDLKTIKELTGLPQSELKKVAAVK